MTRTNQHINQEQIKVWQRQLDGLNEEIDDAKKRERNALYWEDDAALTVARGELDELMAAQNVLIDEITESGDLRVAWLDWNEALITTNDSTLAADEDAAKAKGDEDVLAELEQQIRDLAWDAWSKDADARIGIRYELEDDISSDMYCRVGCHDDDGIRKLAREIANDIIENGWYVSAIRKRVCDEYQRKGINVSYKDMRDIVDDELSGDWLQQAINKLAQDVAEDYIARRHVDYVRQYVGDIDPNGCDIDDVAEDVAKRVYSEHKSALDAIGTDVDSIAAIVRHDLQDAQLSTYEDDMKAAGDDAIESVVSGTGVWPAMARLHGEVDKMCEDYTFDPSTYDHDMEELSWISDELERMAQQVADARSELEEQYWKADMERVQRIISGELPAGTRFVGCYGGIDYDPNDR